jgi:hypothetical protein
MLSRNMKRLLTFIFVIVALSVAAGVVQSGWTTTGNALQARNALGALANSSGNGTNTHFFGQTKFGTGADFIPGGGGDAGPVISASAGENASLTLRRDTGTSWELINFNIVDNSIAWELGIFSTFGTNYDFHLSDELAHGFTISKATGNTTFSGNVTTISNIQATSFIVPSSTGGDPFYLTNGAGTFHAFWANIPTGPGQSSGIGSGGPGNNAWIAYCANDGDWFGDSTIGDLVYRNSTGSLLLGTTQTQLRIQNDGDVSINGNLLVNGKITGASGVDPAYLLYDAHTKAETKARVLREVPTDKQTGAAQFFDSDTHRLEIYVASDDKFYDLAGNVLPGPSQSDVDAADGLLANEQLLRTNVSTNATPIKP